MLWFYFMFIIVYGFDVSKHLVYCFGFKLIDLFDNPYVTLVC